MRMGATIRFCCFDEYRSRPGPKWLRVRTSLASTRPYWNIHSQQSGAYTWIFHTRDSRLCCRHKSKGEKAYPAQISNSSFVERVPTGDLAHAGPLLLQFLHLRPNRWNKVYNTCRHSTSESLTKIRIARFGQRIT